MATKRIVNDLPIAQRLNPSPEGKSIIYDRLTKDYACFLDAQYLGHAATYGDGETRCRDAAYEQLTHTQAETADMEAERISCDELIHEASIGAETVVTVSTEVIEQESYTTVAAGGVELFFDDRCNEPAVLGISSRDEFSQADARALYAILSSPAAQQWMGQSAAYHGYCSRCDTESTQIRGGLCPACRIPTAALAVRCEPLICDDMIDPQRYGTKIGTTYTAGDGAGRVEIYISDDADQPVDIFFADKAVGLGDLEPVIPALLALLNSPQVQAARARRVVRSDEVVLGCLDAFARGWATWAARRVAVVEVAA